MERATREPLGLRCFTIQLLLLVLVLGVDGYGQDAIATHSEIVATVWTDEFTDALSVRFGDTEVTAATLEYLRGLPTLKRLDLSCTKVTDAGRQYLKGLTNLRNLTLQDTHVMDAGLKYLQGLTKLHRLYLYNTQITDAGAEELKRSLPQCSIIK